MQQSSHDQRMARRHGNTYQLDHQALQRRQISSLVSSLLPGDGATTASADGDQSKVPANGVTSSSSASNAVPTTIDPSASDSSSSDDPSSESSSSSSAAATRPVTTASATSSSSPTPTTTDSPSPTSSTRSRSSRNSASATDDSSDSSSTTTTTTTSDTLLLILTTTTATTATTTTVSSSSSVSMAPVGSLVPSSAADNTSSSPATGTIVGVVAAALFGVVALAAIISYVLRKKRAQRNRDMNDGLDGDDDGISPFDKAEYRKNSVIIEDQMDFGHDPRHQPMPIGGWGSREPEMSEWGAQFIDPSGHYASDVGAGTSLGRQNTMAGLDRNGSLLHSRSMGPQYTAQPRERALVDPQSLLTAYSNQPPVSVQRSLSVDRYSLAENRTPPPPLSPIFPPAFNNAPIPSSYGGIGGTNRLSTDAYHHAREMSRHSSNGSNYGGRAPSTVAASAGWSTNGPPSMNGGHLGRSASNSSVPGVPQWSPPSSQQLYQASFHHQARQAAEAQAQIQYANANANALNDLRRAPSNGSTYSRNSAEVLAIPPPAAIVALRAVNGSASSDPNMNSVSQSNTGERPLSLVHEESEPALSRSGTPINSNVQQSYFSHGHNDSISSSIAGGNDPNQSIASIIGNYERSPNGRIVLAANHNHNHNNVDGKLTSFPGYDPKLSHNVQHDVLGGGGGRVREDHDETVRSLYATDEKSFHKPTRTLSVRNGGLDAFDNSENQDPNLRSRPQSDLSAYGGVY